jgi:hypothetical protein
MIAFYLNKKLQIAIETPSITGSTIYPCAGLFCSDHKITLIINPEFPLEIPDGEMAVLPKTERSFSS